ncbi:isocitrate lyase/PEP mutase family protein [Paraburkholderia humisilvae]|uniref:2-methylisocitrate lyase n=1 Tax=Paraburkholderia humisilvae TaxID=627669 RepID=A0A6J5DEN9_9BURK|nr:isocitrate lyase/PEP mutase family protein [Paraburkholderia humisilvae]CAB3751877.1 2,3-dimethylmalate lyase [Paraburkholderia humisilvae]
MPAFLSNPGNPRRRLRELLDHNRPLLAPGSHDALSARLVEQAGFDAVYMGGFATTASLLGRPDIGLLGESEMIDNARRIVQTVGLPVIADADTGYGNPLNVIRTVRDYEQAGVAAIHLEDQVSPKRCGHMSGKSVIPVEDMVAKLRAAVDARTDPDFVLIARTDALAVEGVDAAIERARRYAQAGADILWIEAPDTEQELEKIADELDGHTLLLNWLEGGRTPAIDIDRIRKMKFALVLFPIGSVLAMASALREHLAHVKAHGTPAGRLDQLPSFDDFTDTVGLCEIGALDQRYR